MQDDKEILNDTKNGKVYPWRELKLKSLDLSDSYLRLSNRKDLDLFNDYLIDKSYYIRNCSNVLEFKKFKDNKLKLANGNFCRCRLCPQCSKRRSNKIFGQVSKIMDYVENNYEFKYLFLTLTVKNVSEYELNNTLDNMFNAFKKLFNRKKIKNICNGFFRALEITYNKETNTYHPHFHVIIGVNKTYFRKKNLYLTQSDFTELWQSCLNVDYIPIVDIRKVKIKSSSYKNAIAEISKYTVKTSDYIYNKSEDDINFDINLANKMDNVVFNFDRALSYRRLVSFGGIFKEVHKKLNLDDVEEGNLNNTDVDEDIRDDLNYIIVFYNWSVGFKNYLIN